MPWDQVGFGHFSTSQTGRTAGCPAKPPKDQQTCFFQKEIKPINEKWHYLFLQSNLYYFRIMFEHAILRFWVIQLTFHYFTTFNHTPTLQNLPFQHTRTCKNDSQTKSVSDWLVFWSWSSWHLFKMLSVR